jgi:hypothetical protein
MDMELAATARSTASTRTTVQMKPDSQRGRRHICQVLTAEGRTAEGHALATATRPPTQRAAFTDMSSGVRAWAGSSPSLLLSRKGLEKAAKRRESAPL